MAADAEPEARTSALYERLGAAAAASPLTVGHRGACRLFPENTVVSFAAAVDAGAQMVELDIRQTRDGAFVTVHDATWARTAGDRRAVAATTLAEVRALDAGRWKHARFGGEPVPTLEEALQRIQRGSVAMIERKAGDAGALAALLRRLDLVEDVTVTAFDWEWLTALRGIEPRLTTGALGEGPLSPERRRAIRRTGASMVVWHGPALRAADVDDLHAAGYIVSAFTLNGDIEIVAGAALGLDAIITDDPAHMLALRARGEVVRPGS